MGGAKRVPHCVVSGGTGVLIGDGQGNGGAEGFALVDSGKDGDRVALFALGGDFALAGAAAIQLYLDLLFGDLEAWGAPVNNATDAASVAFAPGCNTEKLPKYITHGGLSM